MTPAEFRNTQGWSQARLALELEIQSRSYICDLEKPEADWPLALALRLEALSCGAVPAVSISSEARKLGATIDHASATASADAPGP